MRIRTALSLMLSSLFAVAACSAAAGGGSNGPGGGSPGGNDPRGIDGRTFQSTVVEGRALVAGSTIRISFSGDQIGASAGCNSMGGTYSIDGDRLMAGQLATTEMGCEEALMDQDRWVAELLNGATIALDGNTLTLAQGGTRVVLVDREVADPDRPLIGTRWVLDGMISGDAVSSVPAGVTAALMFSAGQVDVEAGCNRGSGGVEVTATTIAFSGIALTKMACEGNAMAVEGAVTGVLAGTVGYTIEAGVLTIRSATAGLTFRAAP